MEIESSVVGIINTGNNPTFNVKRVELTSCSSSQKNPMKNLDFHLSKPVESFRGRDQELGQLSTWLFSENKKMAVVSGLPGYGKTELARHVAQRCRAEARVRSVLWLDADSPEVLEQSFRELLRWLGAGAEADLDARSVVQAVHQHFSAQHLFVFDNAPDRQSVVGFEPASTCLCLCTSHVQDWGDDVPSLPLEPLSMDASVDVLRAVLLERFLEEDAPLYRRLADLLSRVPLALQVAAAFVRQEMLDLHQEFSLRRYVEELHISCKQCITEQVPTFSKNPYKISISESIKKSLLKIENIDGDISKLALIILHICAYMNYNKIFIPDLQNFPHISKLSDNTKFSKALSIIENFSFVKIIKDKQIQIHKLIQETLIFYQNHLIQDNHNQYYNSCLEYLSFIYPSNHSHSILKVINSRITTFQNFHKNYESHITSSNAFLYNLIKTGCVHILNLILDALGRRAVDVMNSRCLLHCAVRCHQLDLVEQLLARGARVDQLDDQKDTALLVAATDLNISSIKILTSHNADVNALDREGDPVLHRIVEASGSPQNMDKLQQALEALRWLVGRGARPDAVGRRGRTLVHMAAFFLSAHIVPHLVDEFGLDVNAPDKNLLTPLHHLCYGMSGVDVERRLRTAESLLKFGGRLSDLDKWGATPEEEAQRRGLDYLVAYFQNPTEDIHSYIPQTLDFTNNALRAAVVVGDVELLSQQLDELKERALEVASKSCLLHQAVKHKQYEALEMLLARGVDVSSRDDQCEIALNIAAFFLDRPSMEILLNHKSDINAVGAFEKSVLHYLLEGAGAPWGAGREDEVLQMLRWLVGLGARTDARTSLGETLLYQAAHSVKTNLLRCLLAEFKVNVHAVTNNNSTALHGVSYGMEYYEVEEQQGMNAAACLLEFQASTDVIDAWDRSASQLARSRGFEKLAALLDAAAEKGIIQQQVDNTDRGNVEIDVSAEEDDVEQTNSASGTATLGTLCSWCQLLWTPCRRTHRHPYIRVNMDDLSSDEQ